MANTKAKTAEERAEPIVAKEIDLNQYVTVRNGFQGTLVYRSPRTGERYVWDGFGSEQEIELRELKNAKNTSKGFFINNWFMFDEKWIIDFLGLKQYYAGAVGIDEFDAIFSKTPTELKKILNGMSKGQRKSAAYRARQLIAEGKIDSLKTIGVLENTLGIELTEK